MGDTNRGRKRWLPGRRRALARMRDAQVSGVGMVFHDVEVDCGDQETFLFTYLRNRDDTGIFVRTTCPQAPGTAVSLRFQPDEAVPPLALDGEVIWINPYRPADASHVSPGMGIRFLDLTGEQRVHLLGLVKRLALLVDDDGARDCAQ